MPKFLLINAEHLVNLDQVTAIEFTPPLPDDPGRPPDGPFPARIDIHSVTGDCYSVEGDRAVTLWAELTARHGPRPVPTLAELKRAAREAFEGDDDPPDFDPFADSP